MSATALRALSLDERERGRQIEVLAVGKKGRDFLMRTGQNLVAEVTRLGDYPEPGRYAGRSRPSVINGFREGRYDEVYVIYSEFVNTLVQRPALKRLLPVEPPNEPVETAGRLHLRAKPGGSAAGAAAALRRGAALPGHP